MLAVGDLESGRRTAKPSGILVALSVSLKLFSILAIPYLLWKGHRRAFGWTVGFLFVLWVLVPILAFGVEGAIHIYAAWLGQMSDCERQPRRLKPPILYLDQQQRRVAGRR